MGKQRKTGHKGPNAGQAIDTVASLKAAGTYWNAPSYIISKDEVVAIRQCCAKEFAINPKFIQWLHENNCGRFDKTAKSFKGKQEGADADTVQGYKVKGIQKTYTHLVH